MTVGLDIGSKTIKVVELDKNGDKFSLKSAGVVGYTGLDIEHLQEEKDFVALSSLIKKLFKDVKISSKDVAIALPESQVFTRVVKFPSLTEQEVSSAIKWEAEQYIPIPLNEAIVQHQILEKRDDVTPPVVLVLLIASSRNLVEKYVRVVNMAGLNCVAVETELLSLSRSLSLPGQTVLLIDFGARSTDLAIVRNTFLSFSRSIPTAGEALTRAVAQSMGVAGPQAEEYKRTYGLGKTQLEGKIGSALEPVFRIVVEEIKKAIHFYQSEEKGETPNSVVLTGGSAGTPEVTSFLAQMLGIEVVIGDPFARITVDPETRKSLSAYAPLYAIATGLAMRD